MTSRADWLRLVAEAERVADEQRTTAWIVAWYAPLSSTGES